MSMGLVLLKHNQDQTSAHLARKKLNEYHYQISIIFFRVHLSFANLYGWV